MNSKLSRNVIPIDEYRKRRSLDSAKESICKAVVELELQQIRREHMIASAKDKFKQIENLDRHLDKEVPRLFEYPERMSPTLRLFFILSDYCYGDKNDQYFSAWCNLTLRAKEPILLLLGSQIRMAKKLRYEIKDLKTNPRARKGNLLSSVVAFIQFRKQILQFFETFYTIHELGIGNEIHTPKSDPTL